MDNTSASAIDSLLDDKLFQVIGSTPRSIAESLKKVDFRGKTKEGAQLFAVSVFAAAVNKATLETFLADSRFADIRPLINAALSIQGRSNMTAMTLLGHCFLTTDAASKVKFTAEFRKKMGQNDLWSGELTAGSLSDKQREILKEKKRVTNLEDAKSLGMGFLKVSGLVNEKLTEAEEELFGRQDPVASSVFDAPPTAATSSSSRSRPTPASPPRAEINTEGVVLTNMQTAYVPVDVLNYRRNILSQSSSQIVSAIETYGVDEFISRTRRLAENDPTGTRARAASSIGTSR